MKIYKFIFNRFLKICSFGFVLDAGRNFSGRICIQHKGGGVKAKFVNIDRYRYLNQYGFVFRIIKNCFCSGFIGLVLYDNGITSFVLLAEGLLKGFRIFSGNFKIPFSSFIKFGSTQKLLNVNLFDTIHSVEFYPFSGAKLVRSAGVGAKIISKDNENSVLKLSSGWQIKLSNQSLSCLGVVSNISLKYNIIRKAGLIGIKVFVQLLGVL